MKRLTEKNDNHYCLAKPYINWTNGVQRAFDKLGPIEDILEEFCVNDNQDLRKRLEESDTLGELSEQLECPIAIREKAFNDGFYDENGNHYFCEHYVPYLKSMHTRGVSIGREKHFKLKDYKKSWWLKKDKSE